MRVMSEAHYCTIVRKNVVVVFHIAKTQIELSDESGETERRHFVRVSDALSVHDMIIFRFIHVHT